MYKLILSLAFMLLTACTSAPQGITPVDNFALERYLGEWHEIARLDHSFERGLTKVTAEYSLRDDGGINVINRGFNAEEQEWQIADGKAFFVDNPEIGHLKVSFFGPFYGAYVIFELDKTDYQYAYIAGPNRDYLWLLARQPSLSNAQKQDFVASARTHGFATDELIWLDEPPK
ncbi:MAG TPA: lipocalin family protein [Methylophaga sp.]|nr:lipocalin family protein [Methylophaga sp.]